MIKFLTGFPSRVFNRFWVKPTTVKPRTLSSTRHCDKDKLLEHSMFEILTRFVEEEMIPILPTGQSEMYWDDVIKEEMIALYIWWKKYLVKKKHVFDRYDQLKKRHSKTFSKNGQKVVEYSSLERKEEISQELEKAQDKSQRLKDELKDKMHRLVNISSNMWT